MLFEDKDPCAIDLIQGVYIENNDSAVDDILQ